MAEHGLPRILSHLIELRVSQINGCAYCVKLHTTEARRDGETNERIDLLAAWEHAADFSNAEKVAFAYAEALTYLDRGTDFASLRLQLCAHYEDDAIAVITTCVSMINLWNRMQISKH